ncbi:unnamed protein product [Ectocarpus sp. 12 AP-2014]
MIAGVGAATALGKRCLCCRCCCDGTKTQSSSAHPHQQMRHVFHEKKREFWGVSPATCNTPIGLRGVARCIAKEHVVLA